MTSYRPTRTRWTHQQIIAAGLFAAATCALTGCPPLDNPYRPLPQPDYDQFVATIQPIIGARCAFLGCHGSYQRALTLFAVGQLRAPPSFPGAPLDETRLEDAELAWNYDALRMRLIDESFAGSSRLLLKNIDPADGGAHHADGVVVFDDCNATDCQTLRDWIASGL